jgi:23S rRNA (guanosine2251-2'-O)-methyltransferase
MHQPHKDNFCIFGRKPILDSLKDGKRFDKLLILKNSSGDEIREIQMLARQFEIPMQQVPREKLDSVTQKYSRHREVNHQGIIGFQSMVDYHSIDDVIHNVLSEGKNPLFLLLDGITDVGNFGAIARSAECLGAHALIIPTQGAAQINSEAMKSSAGALNKIFVCREKSLLTTVKYLKANGFRVYGTDMRESSEISKVDFTIPCAIVMGAEGSGVSKEILKNCDETIRIPMSGTTESLNVSVSAGIILYQAQAQRDSA